MSGNENIGMTLTLKKAYEGQFKSLNNVCIFDNFVDIICNIFLSVSCFFVCHFVVHEALCVQTALTAYIAVSTERVPLCLS